MPHLFLPWDKQIPTFHFPWNSDTRAKICGQFNYKESHVRRDYIHQETTYIGKEWVGIVESKNIRWIQPRIHPTNFKHCSRPPPPVLKYVDAQIPLLTPSIKANLMSSDGFQCRFLWFINQLLICFWSSPVISDSFNFSSSWNIYHSLATLHWWNKKKKNCAHARFCLKINIKPW